MAAKRKKHNPSFKSKVALEAVLGHKISQETARAYEIHPKRIAQWERELLERTS
jgi:transposase-like protein